MLNFHDCLGFCALTQAEIDAIAEHEHIPDLSAAIMGNYLIECAGGPQRIRQFILEDIDAAERSGRRQHALQLRQVLSRFCTTYPNGDSAVAQ
jgi:hypothetical protein